MAINLELMKAKLNASKEGKSLNSNDGSSAHRAKLKDGKQKWRLLPPVDGDPFKEYHFHYNLGKDPGFMCPKRNFGEPCSVCEFASELWQTGEEGNKELAKKLFSRNRFFSVIVVRGEEDQGAKYWGYSKKVYEKLISYVLDEEIGDITDAETGRDLVLTYGKAPTGFYDTDVDLNPSGASPFAKNKDTFKLSELQAAVPDFFSVYERISSKDVDAKLAAFMADKIGTEEASKETVKYDSTPAPESVADSIDSAFAKFSK